MILPALVVFDMAGTTIQASDPVPAAFLQAFQQVGVDLPADAIGSVRGKSKREAIAELLARHLGELEGPPHTESVYADFQDILTATFAREGVQPIAGADDSFAWLRARDAKVALTTGFDADLASMLVRRVGWQDAVDVIVCNADVPRGRPAPYLIFTAMQRTGVDSVHEVAVVGDTVSDLESAWNAGVAWSIGVLSGAHTADQLRTCAHTAIIDSVASLPSVFA
jgi:phosphonatase-like hydrolase